ncbi:hypothetical protein [Pseudomonas helleri]|uniref:hypothetical protein n=1 Tax=Pseudomonas helleri TaxID=1608996 RepID=UPI00242D7FD7|nr:hypothetical protein [Pseudomonas helleri]
MSQDDFKDSIIYANYEFAKQRGVTDEELQQMERIYDALFLVLEKPEDVSDPVALIEEMEYQLQGLWKFSQTRDYHSYWIRIKGCTCPYEDNFITPGVRVINTTCKWHGSENV